MIYILCRRFSRLKLHEQVTAAIYVEGLPHWGKIAHFERKKMGEILGKI